MFEVELSLVFFVFGLVFAWFIFPKLVLPWMKEHFEILDHTERPKHPGGRPKGTKNKEKKDVS